MARIEHPNPLRQTAALWYERAGSENAPIQTRSALKAWLDQSPAHSAAFLSVERTWDALKSAAEDPAILKLRQETAQRLAPASTTHRPLRLAVAALILLSLGAMLWIMAPHIGLDFAPLVWLKGETQIPTSQTYSTKTGDRLTIALDDGSHLTLNTDTLLNVSFTKQTRTARLIRGQALFEVAKDATRPFVVQTENHRFIAVGTAFDVHIQTDQVKLTMLEGAVRAESIHTGSTVRTTVTVGQQFIANSRAEDRIRRIDPERETSWRHGQVIFDNTPLNEAVDELNRYSTTHIELADPKLADLRLSGTFATAGTSAFVEAVAAYFPIQIDHRDARTVTLRAVH